MDEAVFAPRPATVAGLLALASEASRGATCDKFAPVAEVIAATAAFYYGLESREVAPGRMPLPPAATSDRLPLTALVAGQRILTYNVLCDSARSRLTDPPDTSQWLNYHAVAVDDGGRRREEQAAWIAERFDDAALGAVGIACIQEVDRAMLGAVRARLAALAAGSRAFPGTDFVFANGYGSTQGTLLVYNTDLYDLKAVRLGDMCPNPSVFYIKAKQTDTALFYLIHAHVWPGRMHDLVDYIGDLRASLKRGVPIVVAGDFEATFRDDGGAQESMRLWARLGATAAVPRYPFTGLRARSSLPAASRDESAAADMLDMPVAILVVPPLA